MGLPARLCAAAILMLLATGADAPALALEGAAMPVAFVQRSVPVGSIRVNDAWKCLYKTGDTVYFSTGQTESRARRKLEAIGYAPVYCRRQRLNFFSFD